MSCEIVANQASGKEFQYCRTHKCESQDCPNSGSALYRIVAERDLVLDSNEDHIKSYKAALRRLKLLKGFGSPSTGAVLEMHRILSKYPSLSKRSSEILNDTYNNS